MTPKPQLELQEEIFRSQQYAQLVQETITEFKEAVKQALEDRTYKQSQAKTYPVDGSFSGASGATFDSSTLGSTSFSFFNQEELVALTKKLQSTVPLDVRKDAIQKVARIPIADMLAEEFWLDSKALLEMVLMDPDVDICVSGLKIYAHAFKIGPPHLCPQVYLSLISGVTQRMEGKQVDLESQETQLILRMFRLILQLSCAMPSIWMRFTQNVFREVVEGMVQLLLPKQGQTDAFYYLSLADPFANWFKKWMLGHLGRQHVISALKRYNALKILSQWYLTQQPTNDLEYLKMLHVTVIFSQMIQFKSGREWFPVFEDHQSPKESMNGFVCQLLDKTFSDMSLSHDKFDTIEEDFTKSMRLCCFASTLLSDLLESSSECMESIVTPQFLHCVVKYLRLHTQKTDFTPKGTVTFLTLNKPLSTIASSALGRRLISCFERTENAPYGSILSLLIGFIKRTLSNKVTENAKAVVSSCVFLLRQFYRSSQGLLELQDCDLHNALAAGRLLNAEDNHFDNMLIDNLLNFAATPKGIVLLHETGNMAACVGYMLKRYKKKMKVSQCEKFGYGTLVSQISTTRSGMQALLKTGWIELYLNDLWQLLECEKECSKLLLDLEDPDSVKTVFNVMKVLTSFHGLAECLEYESTREQKKGTVHHLINTLILTNPLDIYDVPMLEESRLVLMRLLLHMTASLDSTVLLDAFFHIKNNLMHLHRDAFIQTNDTVVFLYDEVSLMMNRVLIGCSVMGGPLERQLPPVCLKDDEDLDLWIYRDKIPESVFNYCEKYSNDTFILSSLTSFIVSSEFKQQDVWDHFAYDLEHDALGFKNTCSIIGSFLDKQKRKFAFDGLNELGQQDIVGVRMVQEYLARITHWKSDTDIEHYFRTIKTLNKKSAGFDWFGAAILILNQGDTAQSLEMLSKYRSCPSSVFLWHLLGANRDADASEITAVIQHWIENLLETCFPRLYSAFTLSGCSSSQLCERWIREAFLNVLDFPDILHYLIMVTLFGPSYQIYFCLALLSHAEPFILQSTRDNSFILAIHDPGLSSGFRLSKHLALIRKLDDGFGNRISLDLASIIGH
ncbi:broad-minded protein-domain-containing protein [Gorgonomyces haynaldii]|nr:broad-minded protein-domain-containing protein [Gorgonomyces haynaldii]